MTAMPSRSASSGVLPAVLAVLVGAACAAATAGADRPAAGKSPEVGGGAVLQGPCELQVAYEVDVVVAGGSTSAVAAAVEAARHGASVFLLTDRPYLGEDLCAELNLALPAGQKPSTDLGRQIFPAGRQTTPLTIKRALDRALLDAGVRFLTGSYPAEVVTDASGRFAGVTMVNRSGRQFVKAKMLIDATPPAVLARQTSLRFTPFVPGQYAMVMRTIGGAVCEGDALRGRRLDWTAGAAPAAKAVHEYRFTARLETGAWRELARVEQTMRGLIHHPDMLDCAERVAWDPNIRLAHADSLAKWPGAASVDLKHFSSPAEPRILILGPCAALSAAAAEAMAGPMESIALGARLGELAAARASGLGFVEGRSFPAAAAAAAKNAREDLGTVREDSRRLRTSPGLTTGRFGPCGLPVLGVFDVVVVGGGTSGAPAAIAAAQSGARTLVVEYLDELGGVGTAGLIGKYWYGMRVGFTRQMDEAVQGPGASWNVVRKSQWLRGQILKAGGEIWFRSYGCGALVAAGRVRGVVVATPHGRGVVLCETVIDSTGNADIAAHAGAPTRYSIDSHGQLAVQLAGYPKRDLGDSYINTCYALVDDCDALDVWRLMLAGRAGGSAFDAGQLVDSRERRTIVGGYTLTTQDILIARTFPDTVLQMRSNFDAAALPTSPMLVIKDMKGPVYECSLPYRCLLPAGLSGIIVTGLGASVQRDAMTLTRMQADLQNQGFAMGMAAAMAARKDGDTRAVDVGALQHKLIEKGILPGDTSFTDSLPMPPAEIRAAVADVGGMLRSAGQKSNPPDLKTYRSLAVVLSHPKQALPLLREAMASAAGADERVNYAKVLAMMGDEAGRDVLLGELAGRPWDAGCPWSSERKTGNTYSDVDRLVIALGRCSGPEVRRALLDKLAALTPASAWSHYQAIALALRNHRPPEAAQPLARLLETPGFTGHAEPCSDARKLTGKTNMAGKLRELITAGMLYSVGDRDGKARAILEQYRDDVGGHYARLAEAYLADGQNPAE